jgi:hypothetical protein
MDRDGSLLPSQEPDNGHVVHAAMSYFFNLSFNIVTI